LALAQFIANSDKLKHEMITQKISRPFAKAAAKWTTKYKTHATVFE
jgi:hypothetical protein